MFIYIWEYIVKENCIVDFINLYGKDGEWNKLFTQDPSFIKTELIKDIYNKRRYLTVDYWESKFDRDNFIEKNNKVFNSIDIKGENLTEKESFLGEFNLMF